MNTATIRRNGSRGGRGGLSGGARRRPSPRRSMTDRLLDVVPLNEDQLHKLITWMLGLVLLAVLWVAALFFGIPGMIWMEMSDLASRAGMQVAKVEVHGTEHMDEVPVYNVALTQVDHSMLNLDLTGVRSRIMKLGWVEDARVSRRLPDTLVVDIVERKPVAVWQQGGELRLVDGKGVVLNGVDPTSIQGLPLVVGPDANNQTEALGRLMKAAPALQPLLAGATWVGNRRWDLQFQSGETLSLPEGEAEAAAALVDFARKDGNLHLLGRGIIRFDARDPARFLLRMPPGHGTGDAAAVPDAAVGTGAIPEEEPEVKVPVEGETAMVAIRSKREG